MATSSSITTTTTSSNTSRPAIRKTTKTTAKVEAKMEFLKRKHFSLWIITLILVALVDLSNGLQGVPTWMCLGIKSPFIEFSNEIEVLANTSVSLNITKDEQALMHQEGLKKLGTFIKPVDLRDAETGFVKANLTKKVPPPLPGVRRRGHINPIQEEMEQKQIVLLDEDTDENGLPASLTEEDRKFIVPMALKNVTPDPRLPPPTTTSSTTTTTTSTTTTATPDFASNIDDLKNHILFLQNMTKHNSNFQSKFVVFPSLQKDKAGQPITTTPTTTTTTSTSRPLFRYTPPIPPPTRRATFLSYTTSSTPRPHQFDHYFDNEDPMVAVQREKITIVPQVLLLNDQTPPDDNEEDSRRLGDPKDQRVVYSKRKNFRKASTPASVSTTISSQTTAYMPEKPFRKNPKRPRNNGEKRNKNQRKPCKNPDSPKCQRQRRRQEQQQMLEQQQQLQQQYQPFQPFFQTINNTKRFAVSIEIPDSFKVKPNETKEKDPANELKLLRIPRSHHNRRNIGGSYGTTYYDAPPKDFIMSAGQFGGMNGQMFMNNTPTPSPTVAAYSEPINLNPDLCYDVEALSYGQRKICVMHPSVMPAISRGARSAIQECQHQFKNRRWNCSTTEDNTVFGPMSSLGSPEMAFIHALASATVTSFIARACRDGQLASCGCSRGARPRQLHDDWAWGGCGDDLEYAYKFSQDFIDIREKERKRGTRGLASGPRTKNDEKFPDKSQSPPAPSSLSSSSSSSFQKKNITATDVVFAAPLSSSQSVGSSSPITEQQNGTTSTTLRTSQGTGNANITVNVDSDSKNGSSISSLAGQSSSSSSSYSSSVSVVNNKDNTNRDEDSAETGSRFKPEVLLELQERITKEILNSKLQEKEMLELQEKINREILNSKVFNLDQYAATSMYGNGGSGSGKRKKNQRAVNSMSNIGNNMMGMMGNGGGGGVSGQGRLKNVMAIKARSLMNLHNNEAGRRAVIKKTRITCKCHGVSGSCSLITCWQQLSSIREIGDYLRERYDEATEVKLNKRGRLQVKDPQFKVPTAHDLVYLDESPDWCRNNRQLQWPGTHGRICNKTSSGLDGCGILCCGRGYNTKNIVVRERCNCKFHWCCQVKCDICVKVLEEHTCK